MANSMVIFSYFLLLVAVISSEFVLRPRDPPSSINTLEVSPGLPLVLRCTTKFTEVNQKWVFNGVDLKPNHGTLTVDGTDSILTIESFDPKIHQGLYACDEREFVALVRIESSVGPELPKGFRPCKGDEKNSCVRGSCGADKMNNIVCVCPKNWSGSKCDTPTGSVTREDRNTDCLIWIIVGGILIGCIVVFSIITITYFFCPVAQCKSKESNLERGTSLIEHETKQEEEQGEEDA